VTVRSQLPNKAVATVTKSQSATNKIKCVDNEVKVDGMAGETRKGVFGSQEYGVMLGG